MISNIEARAHQDAICSFTDIYVDDALCPSILNVGLHGTEHLGINMVDQLVSTCLVPVLPKTSNVTVQGQQPM